MKTNEIEAIKNNIMCTKMIQHSARGVGKTYKSKCNKPEYKNGLCKHHYNLSISKQINWIDRPNYKAATQEDFNKQRSLKLKNSNEHKLFMCQHGIMKEYSKKECKYVQSSISADYTLFCVLVF